MTLLTAIDDLNQFPLALRRHRLAAPVDCERELRTLTEALSRMQPVQHLSLVDPEELVSLKKRLRQAGFNLSSFNRRELRLLCQDSETLVNPIFLGNVYPLVLKGAFRPNLQLLVNEYFRLWRTMAQPENWERLIRHILTSMETRGELFDRYHSVQGKIFSQGAAKFLAENAQSSERSLSEVLDEWCIPGECRLAKAVQDWLVRWRFDQFIDAATNGSMNGVPRLRALLLDLSQPNIDGALLVEILRGLILMPAVDRDDRYRLLVEQFALKDSRFGDPRLPQNGPHWVTVGSEAEHRFRGWRARMDLVFFFDSVLRDGHDRNGRKQFWMQYIDQVEDSVVALCSAHRGELAQDLRRNGIYCPSIRENDGNSCFIMRFRVGGQVITAVEFSKVGSVRLFGEQAFRKYVGDYRKKEFRIAELKASEDSSGVFTFRHLGSWQYKLASELARWGLRPR